MIPVAADPSITLPFVSVSIFLDGASPEDASRLIAKPVENRLRSVAGAKQVKRCIACNLQLVAPRKRAIAVFVARDPRKGKDALLVVVSNGRARAASTARQEKRPCRIARQIRERHNGAARVQWRNGQR